MQIQILIGAQEKLLRNDALEISKVKFQVRWMKKRYKRNQEYRYKRYSIDFPTRLNEKIELYMHKNFSIDFATRETSEQEIITILLTRNKHTE